MADQVEVIQADRDAAADLLDELSSLLDHNGIGQVADLIRDGEYDEHIAAETFAKHRLASLESTPLMECVEALRYFSEQRLSTEAEISNCVYHSPATAMRIHAENIERRDAAIQSARAALAKVEPRL